MVSAAGIASHITFDDQGRACVAGTSYRVDQLVIEHVQHGWTAEEIYIQHYRHLSPAQIHAALAYYYDHQAKFDEQIRQSVDSFEQMRNEAGPSSLATRLRTEGRIR